MKVTDWCKNLRFAILAAGIWVPSAANAQSITLGDPGFDNFVVPELGYAYADTYRPTSAWVDDLDSPSGYEQDAGGSNWLYTSTYAEETTNSRRATPRSGVQAMHGIGNYNAQETAAVFEANKSYRFSIWAQNDEILNQTNGVFLNIFDGTIPFSDTNALESRLFTTEINKRQEGMTPAQSQANWTKITVTHGVIEGSPEIGHPIGVGFFARDDSAVDDATLTAVPIENDYMFLEVNTTNGQMTVKNQTGAAVNIDYYEVTSANNALNATGWNSLQEQHRDGFPSGNGTGNGWEQAGGSDAGVISESFLTGNSAVPTSATEGIGLGAGFNIGGMHDLKFRYGALISLPGPVAGDYNDNGIVDAADYTLWRNNLGQDVTLPNDTTSGMVTQEDYGVWKTNFGSTGESSPSTLTTGFVRYVTAGAAATSAVPEPTSVILIGVGLASLVVVRRRADGDPS